MSRKAELSVEFQGRRLVSLRGHVVGFSWPRFCSVEVFEVV